MVVKLLDLTQGLFHQVFYQRLKFSLADLFDANVQVLTVRGKILAVEPAREHRNLRVRDPGRTSRRTHAAHHAVKRFFGEKCWGVKDVDVYMPAAMQNDVKMESAEKIAKSGVKYYIEVANMPTTNDALNFLREQKHMIVAPSKAVNAGGVGVSGLEMAQNSERLVWTAEEVDAQLHKMMKNIHKVSAEAAEEYGLGYDLVAGANIAGFKKVAQAMYEQGVF